MRILVDGSEFWASLERDLRAARECVFAQTMSFEGDSVGRAFSRALLACPAGDRRVLVDSYTRGVVSDKFLYAPRHLWDRDLRREVRDTEAMIRDLASGGVRVRWTNPLGPALLRMPARNHKKLVVIDDRVAYLGGINFCEHNFAWHDMMLRIEDPDLACFLRDDFLATWSDTASSASREFPAATVYVLDGRSNEAMLADILRHLDRAENEIYITSPYVTLPFFDALRSARQRGVAVVLLTPELNNENFIKEYMLWEAERSDIEVQLYQGRMSHLKAILVDDRALILGSCNFNYLAHTLQEEVIAVVTDSVVIADYRIRVLNTDLENSKAFVGDTNAVIGYCRYLAIKWTGRLAVLVNRMLDG